MRNDLLAAALREAGLTSAALAAAVDVSAKTVSRWLADRGCVPRRETATAVARYLDRSTVEIWACENAALDRGADELRCCFPARSAVPASLIGEMVGSATEQVDVLAYAGGYLWDSVDQFVEILAARARAGVRVRIILADPDGEAVSVRAAEEGLGELLRARVRTSWLWLRDLVEVAGVELLTHDTTLYASIVRADGQLLVNTHVYGIPASAAPVLQLQRAAGGRLSGVYLRSLDLIAATAQPYGVTESRRRVSRPRALRPVSGGSRV